VLEIELAPGYNWYVLYPRANPVVEARIAANHWNKLEIDWSCRKSDLSNFIVEKLAASTCDV
jgi:hypothetical protein